MKFEPNELKNKEEKASLIEMLFPEIFILRFWKNP